MNTRYPWCRFAFVLLITTFVLSSTVSQSTFGQAGRRGGAKHNAAKKIQRGSGPSSLTNQANLQSRQSIPLNVSRSVKRKAQQSGIGPQRDVVRNNRTNHTPQNHVTRTFSANQGPQLATHKFQQLGAAQASPLVSHPAWKKQLARCQFLRQRGNQHFHWSWQKWCGYYPTNCHWWYYYCGPSFYVDPTCTPTYDWYYYYSCPLEVRSLVAAPEVRWALGLKCILIPDKGLGIEAVNPGSPADLAGLEAGMIILSANGMAITDASSMAIAVDQSGGVLQLDVISGASQEPARHIVRLQPLLVTNF